MAASRGSAHWWVVAMVATAVAVVMMGLAYRRATGSRNSVPALLDAAVATTEPPADAAVDPAPAPHVIAGATIDVARGARVIVPPQFEHSRVNPNTVILGDTHGVKLLVGVPSGARLRRLHDPKQGLLDLARHEKLELLSLTTDGPTRTEAHYRGLHDGEPVHQWVMVFTPPGFRAVAYLIVPTRLCDDQRISELLAELRSGRVVLP